MVKAKASPKEISLRDATTEKDLIRLRRDNFSVNGYWLIADEYTVTIAKQNSGEPAEVMLKIPRGKFNVLIDAYTKKQKPRR